MGTYVVEGTEEAGFVGSGSDHEQVRYDEILAEIGEQLGSRQEVMDEIDRMLRLVRAFWMMEPDEVMRAVSAFGARCTELYSLLHRIEGREREWRQVRTQHIVPLMNELERQYKNASRMLEIRRQDLEFTRGQR